MAKQNRSSLGPLLLALPFCCLAAHQQTEEEMTKTGERLFCYIHVLKIFLSDYKLHALPQEFMQAITFSLYLAKSNEAMINSSAFSSLMNNEY